MQYNPATIWRARLIAFSEMFEFAGFRSRVANVLVAPLFVLPAFAFVQRLRGLNRRLQRGSLSEAMHWVLHTYYGGMRHVGSQIPPTGPVLLVCNHPGLGDMPALASFAGRDDLVAVAKERELMEGFTAILDRCILINETLASKAHAVQEIIATLKQGRAVLVYPAGEIEPDLSVFTTGTDAFTDWPPFADLILRRALKEGITVPAIPVYTEGVLHVPAWLAWLVPEHLSRRKREGRAALITMITSLARRRKIRVAVGRPVQADARSGRGSDSVTTGIKTEMVRMARVARWERNRATAVAQPAGTHLARWVQPT